MMNKTLVLVILAVALVVVMSIPHRESFVVPLYARPLQTAQALPDTLVPPPAWLHVEVETNWAWFWQISKGHAWVTTSKQDKVPAEVGKLCIRLTAHGTSEKCEYGVHEINIQEKKRGVQIAKRTAIVSAWTEVPILDTVSVKMEP